ncbi:hypothetical protein NG895_02960 [Aeoliella sp. ICT_H6.2]|uniref:Uncharacterized protein n=1 Tax=Aeoliella straminimaris TaxID=2954799 RepID=A0A9X2FAR0_9BACT|nr:hypothetical protein [Aeoliella straminimaris]MCO6042859.1 hypothetical protein [Aeoliella straminimaris]
MDDKRLVLPSQSNSDDDAYRSAYPSSSESGHDAATIGLSENDTRRLDSLAADDDLLAVVDGWAELPEAVRAGILATVRAIVD